MSYIPGYSYKFNIRNILLPDEREFPNVNFKATEKFAKEFGKKPKELGDVVDFLQQNGFTRNIDFDYRLKDALNAVEHLKYGTIPAQGFVRTVSIKLEKLETTPPTYVLKKEYRVPILDMILG